MCGETLPEMTSEICLWKEPRVAVSTLPSLLKSPATIETPPLGTLIASRRTAILFVGRVTEKKATFDAPPPGPGFTTDTEAVPALATSAPVICAVTRELLTKVV